MNVIGGHPYTLFRLVPTTLMILVLNARKIEEVGAFLGLVILLNRLF